METQAQMMNEAGGKSRSWIGWVALAIVIVIAAFLIWWQGPAAQAPAGTTIGTDDTTSAIGSQLDGIDVGDLNNELQNIDADLNQL